ncbi:lipoate--protein ligase [Spiroplasma platyhelix]|uniref:lipoate--protein ligase n=1 Tax=Spiroplasma platyhelix PALS-1 TaxID=1276218 RepID=A0A846TX43_9MOLU|nr:lipoate--protein ligase [Spiroplasma platyhelix]MBE4704400.1 Lipoate-protein ligase LplJ [Spiroplasma platyhelix PALS-1]NKE38772.1 lipoate--protein ligase [Spiroplasma platyhelix PALS-1]UJB28983.1 lipoate protein ligase A [Spiroplasma platyhelix PALS-1]
MIYYVNQSKDPYFNLALEELLTKDDSITEEILLLWQNDNTIVIGVNQNTIEEINNDYVSEHHVSVVRRLSGGGAVYHDLGNLNFTFIFTKNKDTVRNYALFTQPIIDVLQKIGLNAKFSGKNDILVDGKKISGNAQYNHKNRIMHHGTILFDVDMSILPQVLKPDLLKLQSKGIKSVQARVTNILPLLANKISIDEFKELIVRDLQETKQAKIVYPSKALIAQAEKLADEKYRTWVWNYGHSPEFNLTNKVRIEGKGTVDVRLAVEKGLIRSIKIYGDFLGTLGTKALEDKLIDQPYQLATLSSIISEEDIKAVFGANFSKDEVLSVLIR